MADFNFSAWSDAHLQSIEHALDQWIPESAPADLGQAMRYAVLGGGKRLRPLLALAACESVEGHAQGALRAACALELIHAYSLVHDDMPCMDNDVLRRGKATVHVKYGQATALLAGDALQALAFELLTPQNGSVPEVMQAKLCALLARAAGQTGMAGGQAIDLASVGQALDEPRLKKMHELKTGALLQASVVMGANCGSPTAEQVAALVSYGRSIGLAFQVMDDILDVIADSATLGKTAGKDAQAGKPTYVSILGMARSREYAEHLYAEATQALLGTGLAHTDALLALATSVVRRKH
jgi:farnesyl diphosphate synthase